MHLSLLLEMCQWWLWMKQARSESLGADEYWDLVKWSLVTLCSTGEVEPPLITPLAQCLALVQPHTPSPTLILVQCMKWELHQWALLDWVNTAVGEGSKLPLITVSVWYKRKETFITFASIKWQPWFICSSGSCCHLLCNVPTMYCVLAVQNASSYIHCCGSGKWVTPCVHWWV